MTSAQTPSRLYIPRPFASASGAALTAIEMATGNNVNFEDGFPDVYEAPSANNGKYVTRGEMNAIGNLASVNEFARACGGIITFDQRLAMEIGGYPRGAVLEMLDGITYNRVISLVDDNKVDFTGSEVNTSITGNDCVQGSVDGVNWAYLGNGQIDDGSLIAEIGKFSLKQVNTSLVTWQCVKTFCATRDGFVNAMGTYTLDPIDVSSPTTQANVQFGIVVMEADSASAISGTSPDSPGSSTAASNKAILAYKGTIGNQGFTYSVGTVRMQKGKYYSIWMGGALCDITESTLKIVITQ